MTAICHQPPNPQPSPDPSQDHLYATQATLRTEWRAELDAVKQQLTDVQTTVDRLQTIISMLPKPPCVPNGAWNPMRSSSLPKADKAEKSQR